MPSVVVDCLVVAVLAVLLGVAFRHPRGKVEAAAGLAAAAVVLAVHAVGVRAARDEVDRLFPVVAFLVAILVVSELCAAEGVFAAVGGLVARAGRRDPVRMLGLTFAAALAVTAVLSLDATVVLLTPVVLASATGAMVSSRPLVTACGRLANSASLLLPVSNLTNLLAMHDLRLSFVGFAARMAPVWLVVVAVEYVGHRLLFRRDLAAAPHDGAMPEAPTLPVVPVVVVGLMLVGFAALSPLGVAPAWVAAAAALVLVARGLAQRRVGVGTVVRAAHLPFAVFVLGLGVVVAALSATFLGDAVARLLPHGDSFWCLLGIAAVATVLANVVNNLPATLLLLPLLAPVGIGAILAALVGVNVGSGLTWTGSLANLLWRRTLTRAGAPPTSREFHAVSLVLTPPAVVFGVLTLWAWLHVF